jgi:hypothetical protein
MARRLLESETRRSCRREDRKRCAAPPARRIRGIIFRIL